MLKGWKTVIGIIISAITPVATVLGYAVTGEDITLISNFADQGLTFGGLGLALYGRIKADTPIFKKL